MINAGLVGVVLGVVLVDSLDLHQEDNLDILVSSNTLRHLDPFPNSVRRDYHMLDLAHDYVVLQYLHRYNIANHHHHRYALFPLCRDNEN